MFFLLKLQNTKLKHILNGMQGRYEYYTHRIRVGSYRIPSQNPYLLSVSTCTAWLLFKPPFYWGPHVPEMIQGNTYGVR